ncbi:translation elongation factor [Oceanobacillus piezotolerans]|uniref:Translation elongation factor n=1 Tax=Oceanobacillus piezotolerans TaxID=2448030 RepID=A0A498D501_9BACI|nr:translation elongation factor [Oceanobacillus piezotolerans]RLL43926.1 translation elongation factor [Oceanobacillus piezotolerans]
MAQTKNDKAWNKIFKEYNILVEIDKDGYYIIEASSIRKYREPRLMCKFDHENNLPDIFKENNLSILPISRSKYIIGSFQMFADVTYKKMEPVELNIPYTIQTIDAKNLYSESSSLHFAYHSGMIDDFLGEETKHTVSNRMGSGKFKFRIWNGVGHTLINVESAQIEIDGGYEGRTKFAVIEAKNETVTDFNVRQLFYPYRVWKNKIDKDVVPVFFTYSNDKFSFFMYEFSNEETFNSFKLIKQKDYIIPHESITIKDIDAVVQNATEFVPEPEVPFPQADKFKKVVDLLGFLYDRDINKQEISDLFDFHKRQSDYYANSCIYLGLAESYSLGKDTYIALNEEGRRVMELPFRQKYLTLAEKILQHKIFKEIYDETVKIESTKKKGRKIVPTHFIISRMKYHKLYHISKESTFGRRASTIRGWVRWIRELP